MPDMLHTEADLSLIEQREQNYVAKMEKDKKDKAKKNRKSNAGSSAREKSDEGTMEVRDAGF